MKKLISTLGILTLIFTTSCEKENMESLEQVASKSNAKVEFIANYITLNSSTIVDLEATTGVIITNDDDARIIGQHGDTIVKEALLTQGTEDTKDFVVYSSIAYHIDGEDFLIISQNFENGDNVTSRIPFGQYEIR